MHMMLNVSELETICGNGTARSINGESHREVSQVEEGELFTSFNGELHCF